MFMDLERVKFSGYVVTRHKEGVRFTTDDSQTLNEAPGYESQVNSLCEFYSNAFREILDKFPIFNVPKDIPFLEASDRFTLVDIVKYFNTEQGGTTINSKMNCLEHYDPGLITFSVFSSQPGLELKRDTEWIRPTPGYGIIWLGEAARNSANLPVCMHRVVHQIGTPRITVWGEMCTRTQLEILKGAITGTVVNQYNDGKQLNLTIDSFQDVQATSGSNRVAIGRNSLALPESSDNIMIVRNAGFHITTGSNKVILGRSASSSENNYVSNSMNTYIGIRASTNITTGSDKIMVGVSYNQ